MDNGASERQALVSLLGLVFRLLEHPPHPGMIGHLQIARTHLEAALRLMETGRLDDQINTDDLRTRLRRWLGRGE